jgi:hypothetical protein
MSTAPVTCITGAQMLRSIRGNSRTAGRLRDLLGSLLVEFTIRTRTDEIFIRQAASLAVISERLQTRYTSGDLVHLPTIAAFSQMLRVVLTRLRRRNGIRGPALPSQHERLASFHEMLSSDEDGD